MCQLLNPFNCQPPFLVCSPLLVLSNYHLKCSTVSWGSYCWGVECFRTVSPCPHAHSTSKLTLAWVGKIPLHPSLHSHHAPFGTMACSSSCRRGIILLTHWLGFPLFFPRREKESHIWLSFTLSTEGYLACFPSEFWGLCVKFPSRRDWESIFFPIVDYVSFPMASLLKTSCCSPHLLVVFAFTFWTDVGCYGVVLAMIGPRMTQELFFPI